MAPPQVSAQVSLRRVGEMGKGAAGGHRSLRTAEDAWPELDLLQEGAVCAPSRAPETRWLGVPLDQMKETKPP